MYLRGINSGIIHPGIHRFSYSFNDVTSCLSLDDVTRRQICPFYPTRHNSADSVLTSNDNSAIGDIWITSVNSTNQASDVCRRTTSGSDNNNPHSNVNNNMTTSNVFDFKQYEVDKMYSPQCKRETLYCYNNARSIKRHSPNF